MKIKGKYICADTDLIYFIQCFQLMTKISQKRFSKLKRFKFLDGILTVESIHMARILNSLFSKTPKNCINIHTLLCVSSILLKYKCFLFSQQFEGGFNSYSGHSTSYIAKYCFAFTLVFTLSLRFDSRSQMRVITVSNCFPVDSNIN